MSFGTQLSVGLNIACASCTDSKLVRLIFHLATAAAAPVDFAPARRSRACQVQAALVRAHREPQLLQLARRPARQPARQAACKRRSRRKLLPKWPYGTQGSVIAFRDAARALYQCHRSVTEPKATNIFAFPSLHFTSIHSTFPFAPLAWPESSKRTL